ncbi:MAG TPA: penicillin-binding transpeptidase domain-containing protein [Streptosporangiaceae bacterium]|jgi:cell division protein FtsI/penicillin-binding protein 2
MVARLPRAMMGKIAAVVVIIVVISFGLVQGGEASAEPTVQSFLLAWENGHYKAAAAMTTGKPAVVTDALAGAYRQLDAADLVLQIAGISQHGDHATATFQASVDLGSSGLNWTYRGRFTMRAGSSGWRVIWSPSVIVPGLRPGDRLAVVGSSPARAQLEDQAGRPLAVPSAVYAVGVHPGALADPTATADALATVAGLDPAQVYGQIVAAPSNGFLPLLQLQPSTYAAWRRQLHKVPGVQIRQHFARLFDSIAPVVTGSVGTETAQILRADGVPYRPGDTVGLSGLQAAYQRTLTGSPTTSVVVQNAAGHQVKLLHSWKGNPGVPVRTTLDSHVQVAADRAVADQAGTAAIVAVQTGTGKILAVAAKHGRGMPLVDPLAGLYQPGQAFTIISTAALLQSGFDVTSRIPCKAQNSVGGQSFSNQPVEADLGAQPLFSVDFAHACGTAFAGLSMQLSAHDLATAAADFGIGAKWQLKINASSGTIGNPTGYGQIAATSVGGAGVRVSPLAMALAAGLVQSGTWTPPTLVSGQRTAKPSQPFDARIVASLRSLMRATVTSGAGQPANVAGPPVYGQVGTTGPGSVGKGLGSSWFVGYQGGVAFAILEFTRSPDTSAATLAGSFLTNLQG